MYHSFLLIPVIPASCAMKKNTRCFFVGSLRPWMFLPGENSCQVLHIALTAWYPDIMLNNATARKHAKIVEASTIRYFTWKRYQRLKPQ